MNHAQGYSHAALYIVVLMTAHMGFRSWVEKWNGDGRAKVAMLFAVFTLMMAASFTVSVFMHQDINDGEVDDQALGTAEYATIGVTFLMAVVLALGLWGTNEGSVWNSIKAPFYYEPLFKYLIAGMLGCCGVMGSLFFLGREHYKEHKKDDRRGWTEHYEIYNVYHVQWHIWAGFFSFILALVLFILMKRRFKPDAYAGYARLGTNTA